MAGVKYISWSGAVEDWPKLSCRVPSLPLGLSISFSPSRSQLLMGQAIRQEWVVGFLLLILQMVRVLQMGDKLVFFF